MKTTLLICSKSPNRIIFLLPGGLTAGHLYEYNRLRGSDVLMSGGDCLGGLLNSVSDDIRKAVKKDIECREWHSSIVLEGTVDKWSDAVRAGLIAANRGYKGVVNRIKVSGLILPPIKKPVLNDHALDGKKIDILIIGGGIIGCAIARELSKWDLSILVIDKEEDISMHASSRNDGMIHPGIEPKPWSRKAYFNVRGNKLYSKVTEELDVPFRRSGSIVLYSRRWMKIAAPYFYLRAEKNGVEGMKFLSPKEVKKIEPNITDEIAGGVLFPSTGVLSPYRMTAAYAENAAVNGAEFSLNTIALSMEMEGEKIISVSTNRGSLYPEVVINAAGVYSDMIADMAGDGFFTIHPRKGQIVLLDRKKGGLIHSIVAMPDLKNLGGTTKGGGLIKTIDGNLLAGPDAYEQPFREDFGTDRENIDAVMKKHLPLCPSLSPSDVITYCAGIRASTYEEDFIVEASEYVDNLIHAAGIQSPGLASAPAIAEEIERITVKKFRKTREVKQKENYNPERKGIPRLSVMSSEERDAFIKKRPDYGIIVCRCEEISRGEIADAIHSPIPVYTVDGIKRRVGAGMGRCQGGFCLPNVMQIISEEAGKDMLTITKKGGSSYLLSSETKGDGSFQNGDSSQQILNWGSSFSQVDDDSKKDAAGGGGL